MSSSRPSPASHRTDRRLGIGRLVADELGRKARVARERRGLLAQAAAGAAPSGALARAGALIVHQRLEAGLVDAEPVLGDDLERHVDREAVGVVQEERVGAGDPLGVRVARAGDQLVEALQSLLERVAEALLLGGQPAAYELAALVQLGVLATPSPR